MDGMKCRCGFATISDKKRCPRCGKQMKPGKWPDEGTVLSFTRLQVVPEGLHDAHNLAVVEIDGKGPKLTCWTSETLKEKRRVRVRELDGKYFCDVTG